MRYFFVITKVDQLQPAFDVLLGGGIDVRRAYWDPPERATNPPIRAGVTLPLGQEQESERLLTGAGIAFVHQGTSPTESDGHPTGTVTHQFFGADRYMWASDFPHTDSTWPHSQEVIRRDFAGVPEEVTRKIVYGNAANLYGIEVN